MKRIADDFEEIAKYLKQLEQPLKTIPQEPLTLKKTCPGCLGRGALKGAKTVCLQCRGTGLV